MKELTDNEIQWLEVFAKMHKFFASFLLHYKLKHYLSNNQAQVEKKIINQLGIKGFMSLVKSAELLRKVVIKLGLLEQDQTLEFHL